MELLLLLILIATLVYAFARRRSKREVPSSKRPEPEIALRLEYHFGHAPARGKSPLVWVGAGQPLHVGRYAIHNAMTYVSKGAPRDPEASCIDTKLKVGVPVAEPKGALGYWPQYARISPDQRANYLSWLADGRRGELLDIGYAFIFFYGLERRTLIDRADMEPIITEVTNLLRQYWESRSFQSYLTSFVAYATALAGLEKLTAAGFHNVFEVGLPEHTEESLAAPLAWLHIHKKPLPKALAYEVARKDGRSPRSVVLKRMPEEHRTLFLRKYAEQYGDGMILKPSKGHLPLNYHPSSPTMLSYRSERGLPSVGLPHVLGAPSQFRGLVNIWAQCIQELRKVSTQVGRGLDLTSREAYEALPEQLRAGYDHPDKPKWDQLVALGTGKRGYAKVPVSALAELRDIALRANLTRTQSLDIARAAQQMDYALVPDPWSIQRPYAWDENVAIVASDGKIDQESDNYYHAAALMLELGIGMAAVDGRIEREEVVHISQVIRDQFRLPPEYARRLEVYRDLLIKDPPSLTGLGKRIQGILAPNRRQFLGRFLVSVAAADGLVDSREERVLKRVYRAMGLSPQEVDKLLAELAAPPKAPATVHRAKHGRHGEAIPAKQADDKTTIIHLNMGLVNEISRDTAQVAEMIGRAMGEFDEQVHPQEAQAEKTVVAAVVGKPQPGPLATAGPHGNITPQQFEGLELRYAQALLELLRKPEWTKQELGQLARHHALMPAGLVDEINTWADEHLGDYLIEGEGPYTIQAVLLAGRHG